MNAPAVSCPVTLLPEGRPLGWPTKLFYGVGEIPITVTMAMFGLFAMFFYNSVMGLPAALVGIGIAAGLVVDALTDPYIGYRSDRSRSRWGRRHSFMLPGALAMGPCFACLFSPPRGLGTTALFLWLMCWSMAFRAASALYRIPYLSFGAELTRDYVERTTVISIRSAFGLLGTLAVSSLSFLLFFPTATGGVEPKLHYASYPRMGLVFGGLMTVSGLVTFFGTPRLLTPILDQAACSAKDFFSGFRLTLRNRPFRSIWFSSVLFILAVVLNGVVAVHYFTWYAQIHQGATLSGIQACFYIGALAGVLCWLGLAKKTEKHRMYLAATIGMAFMLCLAFLVIGEGRLFGAGKALPLLAGHVIGGLLASAVWVLPASMLADATDLDELTSGQRRAGIYFGILAFGEKIAACAALLIAGLLLNFFVHLAPGSTTQSPTAAMRVGLVYGPIPAVILVIAALLILPYSLDRRAVRQIQESLARPRTAETHG